MFQQAVMNAAAKRVAVVSANTIAGPFTVRLYVNCESSRKTFKLGDPTLTTSKTKTLKGAMTSGARMVK